MKRLLNDPVMNDTGWPDHNKKVKCFSSQSLLGLPRLSNKCVTDQFRTALTKRLKELSQSLVASIINPAKREWLRCTRLLFLRCALSLHGHSSGDAHWAYKGCYYCLQVNIKPTRLITSTSRNYQKATSHPTRWSLSRVVLQLKKLFSEPRSFGLPSQVPTRVGRFFINWSSTATYLKRRC